MENLSLAETPPTGGPGGPPLGPGGMPLLPQQQPQLPPQMFTTAAQLLDLTDTNLVLQSTIERIFTTSSRRLLYADIPRGVFLVRGENVLLLGEIDLDKDDIVPEGYELGSIQEVHRLAKEERKGRERKDERKVAKLREEGFERENVGEILL
ncbi:MAG: SM-like, degradation of cytoplasmic mRNAs and positively regulates transcription initiation [Claussenomyces sp. TS43310]|nr:MAG: SM-like, degradation of cytoplasmic mRNAs and positively regulates transcription initiation [Claussenomyces sp. TS43310]